MSDASRPLGPGGALPGGTIGRYGRVDSSKRTGFLSDFRSRATMYHLSCTALSIGKWSCENEIENDLIIFYSLEARCITYYIGTGYRQQQPPVEYKIVYPFSHIKKFEVQKIETTDPTATETSRITIELTQFPKFFETQSENGCISFKQCADFTDREASLCKVHFLHGQHGLLTKEMTRLHTFMSSLYGSSIPRSVNDSSVTMEWSLSKLEPFVLGATATPATSVCERSEYSRSIPSVSQLRLRESTSKSQASLSLGLQTDCRTVEGEVPFTDSGYASAPKLKRQSSSRSMKAPKREPEETDSVQCENEVDDRRTSYSAATTIDHNARTYISEFCSDIYNHVLRHIDVIQWPTISQVLPDFLKAFAIRIGHSNSSQLSWDIMYFIHKRNKDITAQLEDMFQHERNEMADEHNPPDLDGMSVQDKMNLWSKMLQINDVEVDKSERFEGVPEEKEEEEDDDSMMNSVDPKKYRQAIHSSPAYTWFITALQKEFSIQKSDAIPSVLHNIRQEVLKWLPSGRLSKTRAPQVHRATFRVDFRPDLEEGFCIASELVITCTEREVQATTLRDYCGHFWPFSGLDILSVIERAIINRSTEPNGFSYIGWSILDDRTVVGAASSSNCLLVTVEGSAFAVAECGEQLACLAPALGLSRTAKIVQGKPCIEPAKYPYLDVLASLDPSSEEYLALSFLISIEDCSIREGWPCEDTYTWFDLEAAVVIGYPTTRRPEKSCGLEVPFGVLRRKFQQCKAQSSNDAIRVESEHITLELVDQTLDVFYWHGLNPSEQPFRCALHATKVGSGKLSHKYISESDLSDARHIVCNFADELLNDKNHTATSSPQKLLPFPELVVDNGEDLTASSPTSGVLDLDLLSISSDSKLVDVDGKRHTGYRVFVQVLYRLNLLCHTEANNEGESNKRDTTSTQNKQRGSSSVTVKKRGSDSTQRQKRPRGNSGNSEENARDSGDDGNARRPRKRAVRQTDCQRSPTLLACPFWKQDAQKHVDCFLKKIDTIGHLKQHLMRRHTPAFYCQRCFVKFSEEKEFDNHVEGICVRDPTAKLEGISHSQKDQLSRKFRGSGEEQWYHIWDILFPEYPRPASIYIDNSLSEDFCQIREICQREGIGILIEELSASGLVRRTGATDELLYMTLQRAMDFIFGNYVLGRSPGSEEALPSLLSTPNEPDSASLLVDPGTVGGSSTASGVATGSNLFSESHQSSSMQSWMVDGNDAIFPQYSHHPVQQSQGSGLRTTLSSTFGDFHIRNTESWPAEVGTLPVLQYQQGNELRQDYREMGESRHSIDFLDNLLAGVAEDGTFVYFN